MTEVADLGTVGASAPITYVAGDFLELVVTVLDGADDPVDITAIEGAKYVITKADAGGGPSGVALVSKTLGSGVEVTDGPAGRLVVTLDNGDTGALAGHYRHELEVTDSDGRIATVLIGSFVVTGQAILPTP